MKKKEEKKNIKITRKIKKHVRHSDSVECDKWPYLEWNLDKPKL